MNSRWHDLIQEYISGTISTADAQALERELMTDPMLRDSYLEALNLDTALEMTAQSAEAMLSLPVPPAARALARAGERRTRAWSWRPLAAGLVLGMFCTSVVMAYMVPSSEKVITLFGDDFEDSEQQFSQGFPEQTGVWGGDAAEVVSASSGIQPVDGQRMLRLDSSPTTTLSYLDRIVDVRSLPLPQGNEVRQVMVTASFHAAERGLRDRYTLRVAAFAEAPDIVRTQWVGREWREMDGALAASKRGLSTTPEAEGWQTLTAIVEVPREARSLVISLAGGLSQNPDQKTAHYIDGVHATLSITSHPAATKTRVRRNKAKAE
ncbi:hypothetical protein [Prosthecobacter sp.]|uniref:hypothetical protein n=1 Tax=Prosthecobacter sp. TaxID=1965333 RepID=UPI0037831780